MSEMTPKAILSAMRATHIPEGDSGLWSVKRKQYNGSTAATAALNEGLIALGGHTFLFRVTEETMHLDGEIVMEDSRLELQKHMNFCLRASGDVLVTGLGLGCVVRGLLENPCVNSITVAEREKDVINLVGSTFAGENRVRIVHEEALKFISMVPDAWDCAWHDLWSDDERGEKHLDIIHLRLMHRLRNRVKAQGAWSMNRTIKRRIMRSWGSGFVA